MDPADLLIAPTVVMVFPNVEIPPGAERTLKAEPLGVEARLERLMLFSSATLQAFVVEDVSIDGKGIYGTSGPIPARMFAHDDPGILARDGIKPTSRVEIRVRNVSGETRSIRAAWKGRAYLPGMARGFDPHRFMIDRALRTAVDDAARGRESADSRTMVLPIPETVVESGSTVRVAAKSQLPTALSIERLVIPSDIASLLLVRIFVNGKQQMRAEPMPAAMFSEVSGDGEWVLDDVVPMGLLEVEYTNVSGHPVNTRGAVFGSTSPSARAADGQGAMASRVQRVVGALTDPASELYRGIASSRAGRACSRTASGCSPTARASRPRSRWGAGSARRHTPS